MLIDDNKCVNFKVELATISSDNLSAHSLAGFNASFNAGRICRFCMASYDEIKHHFAESDFLLRSNDLHLYHLEAIANLDANKAIYGVRDNCCLSVLPYFEVVNSFPPDAMHDVLEGIIPALLKALLSDFVNDKLISIDEVNHGIDHLQYGQNDRKNKPPNLPKRLITTGSISGSASEKWCLFRNLPLMIGNSVPAGHKAWELYLLFRDIADVTFAPVIDKSWIPWLQDEIQSFLESFALMHPESFVPKFHFLVHYPRLLVEFGPLKHLWCMRFEAKHSFFKTCAKSTNNFINIASSLAMRHQFHQCLDFQNNSMLNDEEKTQATCLEAKFSSLEPEVKNAITLPGIEISPTEVVWKTNKAKINSIEYKVNDAFVLEVLHGEEIPLFLKVATIVKIRSIWLICGKLYKSIEYSHHTHCFKVANTKEWVAIRPGMETDYHPLDIYNDHNDDHFVTLRHRVTKSSDDAM